MSRKRLQPDSSDLVSVSESPKKKHKTNYISLYPESDKYICSFETLKETLSQYGVAIVPEVLDKKECENMFNGMWDYLEHATQNFYLPMKREGSSTWKEMRHLWPLHN